MKGYVNLLLLRELESYIKNGTACSEVSSFVGVDIYIFNLILNLINIVYEKKINYFFKF
jgi:hypothetical protein